MPSLFGGQALRERGSGGRLTKSRSATSANASGRRRRRSRGERVARRHDQDQPVAPVRHRLQAEGGGALGEDADLGATVDHREHGFAAVGLVHLDADAGVRGDEARQVGWQELRHRRGVGPQPDDADDPGRMVGQVGGEVVDIGQDALRMPVQRLAGQGEGDAARVALEQLGADGSLEVRNALARRTDRQVRQLGAAADAAGAHDQAEQRQRDEVEAVQVHGGG